MSSSSSGSSKQLIPMQNKFDRVILLVDMDCFYCQVEEKLDPTLKGKPLAVVQYNAWRGGGIIAVNYAARAKGVTRHLRGDEAKEKCPDIQLVKVPNVREKADLTKYRDAGTEVANVLQKFTPLLERASVDEAYLDITEAVSNRFKDMVKGSFVLDPKNLQNTYVVGSSYENYMRLIINKFNKLHMGAEVVDDFQCPYEDSEALRSSDLRLILGASIAGEIRAAVKAETSYECSAGVAHNKILAKLAAGLNKPNKQTILPIMQTSKFFETLPVKKIKGLGAKFGEEVCERLGVQFLGEITKFTEAELQTKFDEKNGTWLYNICRGIDLEAVTRRFYSKSIGCCKKFPGRNCITGLQNLTHWINELANEICDRLQKDITENNRKAKQMVVSYIQDIYGEEISSSRSTPLNSYERDSLAKQCLDTIKINTKPFLQSGSETTLNNSIKFLSISVGKFETVSNAQNKLQEMFAIQAAKKRKSNETSASMDSTSVIKPAEDNAVKVKENKTKGLLNYFQKGVDVSKNANSNTDDANNKNETKCEQEHIESLLNEEDAKVVLDRPSDTTSTVPNNNNADKVKEDKSKSFFRTYFKKDLENVKNECESNEGEKNHENKQDLIESQFELKQDEGKSFFRNYLKKNTKMADNYDHTESSTLDVGSYEVDDMFNDNEQNSLLSLSQRMSVPKQSPNSFIKNKSFESSEKINQNANLKNVIITPTIQTKLEENNDENPIFIDINSVDGSEVPQSVIANAMENEGKKRSLSSSQENETIADSENEQNLVSQSEDADRMPIKKKRLSQMSEAFSAQNNVNALNTTNYQAEYAEYATPQFQPHFLKFKKCDDCGVDILDDEREYQSHLDYHYAQKLSHQLRVEYRQSQEVQKSEQKKAGIKKILPKSKTSAANTSTLDNSISKMDITKFLSNTQNDITLLDEHPSTSAEAILTEESEYEICNECKKTFKKNEMADHRDFHIAKSLQIQLNKIDMVKVRVNKKAASPMQSSIKNFLTQNKM